MDNSIASRSRTDRVGFIGLGNMGRPMASNLCAQGVRRSSCTTSTPAPGARARGARRAARGATSPTSRPPSDIVFTMLPDSAAVDEVIAGADGVLAHLRGRHA